MVSRDAAQEEAARQIAPGSRTIRSGFWNTLCPPRHSPAKTPFHNFLPQGTAAFIFAKRSHIRPLSGLLVGSPAQGA